ncbi:homeobox protein HAT3.1 [Juglans microcarpa x Juglans regia]|uniref:homeobox protein HAT3.1 n=1 Tax=Juglans microcarpa x Juglans regia TaxID=2249226 RepID=UPI001B7DFBED|nr:homeobox protein HAT3.1 [Juglans microcarpa x Juglans regia]
MDASSAPVSSQTGKPTCPEQNESGQMDGSLFSGPSERRLQLGSEISQNEQVEISFPENVAKSSLTEQLGPPPEDVSNSFQAGKSSYSQKNMDSVCESKLGSLCSELSDQENRAVSELLQSEPEETSSALPTGADNKILQSSSENATSGSLTVPLQLHSQVVAESSETGRSLCPHQTTLQNESDAGGLCGKPLKEKDMPESESKEKDMPESELEHTKTENTNPTVSSYVANEPLHSSESVHTTLENESNSGGLCGKPLKEQDKPESELVHTRTVQTSPAVLRYVADEQLQSTESLGLPSDNVSKSSQIGKISPPQQTTHEEFGFTSDLLDMKCQIGSDLAQNEPVGTITAASNLNKSSVTEHLELLPEDVSRSSQTEKSSYPQQTISEQTHEFGSGISEQFYHLDSKLVQNVPAETSSILPSCIVKNGSATEHIGLAPKGTSNNLGSEKLGPPTEDTTTNFTLEQLERPAKHAFKKSRRLGRRDNRTPKSLRKKYMLRSLAASDRVLRSRTHGMPKATGSSSNLANVSTMEEKQRKSKKRRGKRIVADEFSRIRTHLRYLLNRISYEQNLIDAYSSEGWKGGSLEKLKPEKELQRATSEILRRKLKIRDLFQHLGSLCTEGRLPGSLFDSEGEICSEDIFCAKCGSKDLSADNDIILCDGACDRGFHQYCLEPPLSPDEKGWLCPGCDCKVDCIDLLNETQGTDLSLADSWEKVFPEAAATAGHNPDHNFSLPSDDSDDNDYNPDGQDDEKVLGDESSSDESEYASATEDLETPPNDDQYLGLPSDDSEDDDYNPDAADHSEKVKQESSSSDFTSDSEDLAAAVDDNRSSRDDEDPMSASLAGVKPFGSSGGERPKPGGKKQSLNDELLSILESDPGQAGFPTVSGKRHMERLDYKKLHDETYGNVSTDSSDDEDYNGAAAPRKRKKTTGEVAPLSPSGKNMRDINQNRKVADHTPKRRTRQNANIDGTSNSPTKSLDGYHRSGSGGKRIRSSTSRRLGEAVTQRLYKVFKENQYPERATKESLAQELGITFQQVSKWFENARWSFHHSSLMEAGGADSASKAGIPSSRTNMATRDTTCNGAQCEASPRLATTVRESSGDLRHSELETRESCRHKSTTTNSRKRKGRSDPQASDPNFRIEELKKANKVQAGGGMKTRRRKSVV